MDDILAKKNRHLFLEEKDNQNNSFIGNINDVANRKTELDTVAAHIENVDTVGNHIDNVDTVANNISDINDAVDNIATVKTFNDNVNNGTMQYLLEAFTTSLNEQGNAWEVRLTQLGESILATTSAFNYSTVVTVSSDIPANGTLILPNSMKYKVGTHMLMVSWNGTVCYAGDQYDEVGAYGVWATSIKLNQPAKAGDKIQLRIVALTDQSSYVDITEAAINASQFVASGSNTERYLPEFLGDIVNVKNFGAIGNGVNDDTTAFQSAIASGKAVFVPEGTYKLNTDLNGVFCGVGNSTFTGGTVNGSTILRGIAQRNSDIINVEDYGAKGDGITDDTLAIQSAFNAAQAAGGGDVIFPAGVYCTSGTIQFGGNIHVIAYGATIKGNSTSGYSLLTNMLGYDASSGPGGYNGNSNIFWEGGILDGNCQSSAASISRQGIAFSHAHNIHLHGMSFKNCRRVHSLEFAGCRDVTVTECSFFGQYPPVEEGYYPEVIQINPCIEGAIGGGTYLDGTENNNFLFHRCLITNAENSNEITESSPMAGIGSHGNLPSKRTENIAIRECVFRSIQQRAVSCFNTMFYNWEVSNCYFENMPWNAITIKSRNDGVGDQRNIECGNFTISGNTFINTRVAIYETGFSDYLTNCLIIKNNIAKTKLFANIQHTQNVLIKDNIVELDASEITGNSYSATLYGVKKCIVDSYKLSTINNSNAGDITAFSTNNDCKNISYQNVISDKASLPFDLAEGAVDGIHTYMNGPHVFRGKSSAQLSSGEYKGAPAICLTSNSPIFAPQLGYLANQAFWVAAYKEDNDGNSVIGERVILLYGESGGYSFCPGSTNKFNLGASHLKWKEVFSGTGAINTSDLREKKSIDNPPDSLMRAWGKVDFKLFKFKDAVEKKGESARSHVGIIAQQVRDAFASEGLDASRYGLFCYDSWNDEWEDVEVVDVEAVLDEDGNVVTPAQTHMERRQTQSAGDSYGIRYAEALALECAYQRWLGEQRDAKIEALMQRISALENNH